MRKFGLVLLLLCFACGVSKNQISTSSFYKTYPELNQINKVEIGVTLVTSEKGYLYKALRINEDRKVRPGNLKKTLTKGELFLNKYETTKYWLFESPTTEYFGIAISKDGGKQKFYLDNGAGIDIIELNSQIDVTEITATEKSKEYFKQEFIYNGKVGNAIKFTYREFIDDRARPAFTQELQYDLSESSIIGFRGLRIDVLKATNIDIEYKLLNQFTQ